MDKQFLDDFRHTVSTAEQKLLALSETQSETPRAAGKWSPKEIIGHLIDSASNNHQRFVRAQFKDDLIFDVYGQDDWVKTQRYNNEEWKQLLTLWKTFNLHLLHVVAQIPESVLHEKRAEHNLHLRAWKPVPEIEPATLDYFIRDYLGHMKHHLCQILSDFYFGTVKFLMQQG